MARRLRIPSGHLTVRVVRIPKEPDMNPRLVPILAVICFTVLASAAEQKTKPVSPEQKVLDQFLGDWRQSFTIFKTQWTPKEKRGTGTFSTTRILGGQFVQEAGEKADGNSHLTLYTYDEKQKAYRMWYFSSTGSGSDVAGQWDAATKSLVWKFDVGTQFKGTGTHRFANDDTVEFSTVIKDGSGELLFHRAGKSTRVKKTRK
jgi:hypothetical protein